MKKEKVIYISAEISKSTETDVVPGLVKNPFP